MNTLPATRSANVLTREPTANDVNLLWLKVDHIAVNAHAWPAGCKYASCMRIIVAEPARSTNTGPLKTKIKPANTAK